MTAWLKFLCLVATLTALAYSYLDVYQKGLHDGQKSAYRPAHQAGRNEQYHIMNRALKNACEESIPFEFAGVRYICAPTLTL